MECDTYTFRLYSPPAVRCHAAAATKDPQHKAHVHVVSTLPVKLPACWAQGCVSVCADPYKQLQEEQQGKLNKGSRQERKQGFCLGNNLIFSEGENHIKNSTISHDHMS